MKTDGHPAIKLAILDSRSTEGAVAFGCRERGKVDNSDLRLPTNDLSSYIDVPKKAFQERNLMEASFR
jgi:hypothetical protein